MQIKEMSTKKSDQLSYVTKLIVGATGYQTLAIQLQRSYTSSCVASLLLGLLILKVGRHIFFSDKLQIP